ncbi:hypothetical protein NM688_g344 [Phlebia brevispora]|uniref:Uncharacterized protein n=1 Tax=Phlebia brevispora TaxID=194682 RepID=A0ACC1TEB9_9APHY|nr:hypothetical protein NM688_g344 [Phlebia brevispora]
MTVIDPETSMTSSRSLLTTPRYPSRKHAEGSTVDSRSRRKKSGQEAFSDVQESLDTTSIPGSEASPAERAGVLTFSGSIFLEGGIHEFCADDHEVAPQIQIPKAATRKGRKKLATNSTNDDNTMDASDSATEDGEDVDSSNARSASSKGKQTDRPVLAETVATSVPINVQPSDVQGTHNNQTAAESPAGEVHTPAVDQSPAIPVGAGEHEAGHGETERVPRIVVPASNIVEMVIENPGWIPDDVMARLKVIAAKEKLDKYRFAMSKVAHSETVFGGFDGSLLCFRHKALTVLFLGRLRSTYFTTGESSEPARCASVKFKFLSNADEAMARLLVHDKANPRFLTSKKTFWASQKCTYWSKVSNTVQAHYFSEIYDGTREIKAKHLMQKIPNYQLHSNDIVLLECQIQRYAEKGQRKKIWNSWSTNFKLLNITKVFEAPPSAVEEPESEDETMHRDNTDDEDEAY